MFSLFQVRKHNIHFSSSLVRYSTVPLKKEASFSPHFPCFLHLPPSSFAVIFHTFSHNKQVRTGREEEEETLKRKGGRRKKENGDFLGTHSLTYMHTHTWVWHLFFSFLGVGGGGGGRKGQVKKRRRRVLYPSLSNPLFLCRERWKERETNSAQNENALFFEKMFILGKDISKLFKDERVFFLSKNAD